MATYVVMGNPIPLARHRHNGRATWDSQKELKLIWGLDIARQHLKLCGDTKYSGPLHLEATFYLPIPKTSEKRATTMCGTPHVYTPDLDNLIKWIGDAVTGVLFENDCIISSIACRKIYDIKPRTEFTLRSL